MQAGCLHIGTWCKSRAEALRLKRPRRSCRISLLPQRQVAGIQTNLDLEQARAAAPSIIEQSGKVLVCGCQASSMRIQIRLLECESTFQFSHPSNMTTQFVTNVKGVSVQSIRHEHRHAS